MKKLPIIILMLGLIANLAYPQSYGWVALNPASIAGTPDLSDLSFIGPDTGWISTSAANSVFYTVDGAANFTTQAISSTIRAIHMLDTIIGYAASNDGSLYRTTSGGTNWTYHAPTFATLNDITFPRTGSTEKGYACGDNGALFSVTSSGATAMTSGVVSNLKSITFPAATEGWVCGQGVILHSANGIWLGDQGYPSGTYNAIYFTDNQNGWAVGNNGIIIHTTDGQNWTAQTNPDPQNRSLYSVCFLNSNEGWTVGFNSIILHTTNGGTNWNVEGSGLTTAFLRGVHFTSSTNGYIVGNNKTLLKYTQLSGIENQEPLAEINIYPNPATHTINIECPKIQSFKLSLFNIIGEQLMQKDFKKSKEAIDISALPPGMYFASVIMDKQMIVKKIIKQ